MTSSIAILFVQWFFAKAPLEIIRIGKNFLAWGWHFFSVGYLLPRLLSPWHRDITGYGRGFDLKRFFQVLIWNLISRVIGAFLRAMLIVFGLLAEVLIFALALFWFLFWFLIPAVIIVLFAAGVISFLF